MSMRTTDQYDCDVCNRHFKRRELFRWLTPARKPAHAKGIQLIAMKYAMVKLKGIRAQVFQTDIVPLDSIIGLCFIQPVPLDAKVFYYNHWIGNTANDDPRHTQSAM